MRTIFTILAMLAVSAIFAQTPKKMVLIPDYPETFNQEFDITDYDNDPYIPVPLEYRRSNDIFIIGNFNEVNIIRPMINIPQPTVDNNNPEYIKTTHFNPNKTLQEILRDD